MNRMKNNLNKNKKQKIKPPTDEKGKAFWIPVVFKNKDTLIGFIEAFRSFAFYYDTPLSDIEMMLSSERFNDTLRTGDRMRDLTRFQVKEIVKKMISRPDRSEHVENDEQLYSENVLNIDCPKCGMFYSFKSFRDIPEENLKCQMCERTILFYSGLGDHEIEFDGDPELVDSLIEEIKKETLGDDM